MKQLDLPVAVDSLRLDPENPRLPETIQGSSQASILEHLYEHDVLEEIVASYLESGYFLSEPLIVLPEGEDGSRVVVEGNRRLAALLLTLGSPIASEAGIQLDPDLWPFSVDAGAA